MLYLLLVLVKALALFADFQEFLKPATGKEGFSSPVEGVDFIYMINLDQRPEKYNLCAQLLKPYGILPYRFSAVNGWELPIHRLSEMSVEFQEGMRRGIWGTYYRPEEGGVMHHELIATPGQFYFSHHFSRGAIGIVLSHLSILQDAYANGYETIWVMEDDIEVIQTPYVISERIKELDALKGNKWDILFTDRDTKDYYGNSVISLKTCERPNFRPADPFVFLRKVVISQNLRFIGSRYGVYSYIIRRSGMEKILNFFKKYALFLPFDIDIFMIPNIQSFTVLEDIVSTQPQAISDNGKPRYLNK